MRQANSTRPASASETVEASPASGAALEVSGLTVDLGGRPVLTGLDLSVAAGQFLGLLGPNGAGKTTLLRAILGLIPHRGDIRVSGRPAAALRGRIGYVPQRHEFTWDFPISVEDVVLTGRSSRLGWLRRPQVADYQAVNTALAQVELDHVRRRPVAELSGGQRQRVLVARALAMDSQLLLLDEPFTGVDMPTAELLTGLFGRLAAAGRTVIMSTHDLPAAMVTCTQIALLRGTIRLHGTPDEVRDPEVWMDTFSVSATSPLLTSIGLSA
ncbi:anchored repeat-type ABC transporter ATP-binding subunit [Brevibacterium otitidis]|uniref:Anchored repeat-type ABC transporter ATP-binding subunit n=1 Tax=Brevibacterium otitidis TaxID=53364 RepID=A0ABV5X1R3_9MICO|nr:anchored repeat-type ABC transporter ATP-binding subunit [Brevibacterium otitidis]